MKYIPVILAGLFTFIFALLTVLSSVKFTKAQRNKYSFLKLLDGKQIFLVILVFTSGGLAFIFGVWKDFATMQPSNEGQERTAIVKASPVPGLVNKEPTDSSANENTNNLNHEQAANTPVPEDKKHLPANAVDAPRQEKPLPTTPQFLAKARSLYAQGKYNNVIRECDRILSVNPKNSDALALKKMAQKQISILGP